MNRVKRIWYLSPMRAAKVQASLRIRAVSPEPSLLAHTSSESRGTFWQKARSLAPLNGWACAIKICHDGMLEDTNSLDGAQIRISLLLISIIQSISLLLISIIQSISLLLISIIQSISLLLIFIKLRMLSLCTCVIVLRCTEMKIYFLHTRQGFPRFSPVLSSLFLHTRQGFTPFSKV